VLTERVAQAKITPAKDARPSIWETLRERASIPQALHALLERQARRQPTLLVVEDVQWMDAESRRVLRELVAAAPEWPLFLLTTTRPDFGKPSRAETDWWTGDQLPLPPLSDEGSRELAAFALRATQLEPELADWLLARTGGSPLFILFYCRALRDADAVVVDPASDEARWNGPPPQLPLSLQEILLAQVDRLEEETRQVMRRGSVIGATFPIWLLVQLTHDVLPADQLDKALDQAARRALIAPPPPVHAHTFSSQSLHDAIYTTLSHTLRRDWHKQVGDQLDQAGEPTRYKRLEQIAHHYSRSGNHYKAAHFTRLAGDKARARQADEAALAFYAQALAVSDGPKVATERRLAHEGIGDVHALRGEDKAARAAYEKALQEPSPGDERRLKAKLALLAPLGGATETEPLEEVRKALPSSDPLRPWLGAALVWLRAGRGEVEVAALCRDLLPQVGEPINSLLQESSKRLEGGEPLPLYADLFALFARSCLRLPPGSKL
jgi:tetratricopeptide (TPR) repeat protein